MISVKTSALMAAMAVLGTVAPAAFAQDFSATDSFNYVEAYQSNSVDKTVNQNIAQYASGYAGDDGTVEIDQDADQGFCEQINQQNAASGGSSNQNAANVISAAASGDYSENEAEVDCS
jgi:hypothetical protein